MHSDVSCLPARQQEQMSQCLHHMTHAASNQAHSAQTASLLALNLSIYKCPDAGCHTYKLRLYRVITSMQHKLAFLRNPRFPSPDKHPALPSTAHSPRAIRSSSPVKVCSWHTYCIESSASAAMWGLAAVYVCANQILHEWLSITVVNQKHLSVHPLWQGTYGYCTHTC